MVRSVESVVDLLQKHLFLTINSTSAEVLRLNCESVSLINKLCHTEGSSVYYHGSAANTLLIVTPNLLFD